MSPHTDTELDPDPRASDPAAPRCLRESRPRLLISLRSLEELEDGLRSGADIIDLKEPRAGALAPASEHLWLQTAERWRLWEQREPSRTRPWLSAALGEAKEARDCARRLPAAFDFAKAGPSGCHDAKHLGQLWGEVREQLHDSIELVAVAYADWKQAGCLPPASVFQLAREFGLRRCLLDTFQKDGRSSIQILGTDALKELQMLATRLDLWWTLAGSIVHQDVRRLRELGQIPDCFGVRGDICDGSRQGRLQLDRVGGWIRELQACPVSTSG